MKVTLLLADAAEAINGKLYILGGGWSIRDASATPMAIAIKIEVPWTDSNTRHRLRLALFDEDAQPVKVTMPTGDRPVEINSVFEVGRPPGLKPGTPLDFALAINISALTLRPDTRYVWHCYINDKTEEGWQVSFCTRPEPAQPKMPHPPDE
jgi:hypothetical protein